MLSEMIDKVLGNLMMGIINLIDDEDGQGMVEYALIIGLVALVVITALTGIGNQLIVRFNEIVTELT